MVTNSTRSLTLNGLLAGWTRKPALNHRKSLLLVLLSLALGPARAQQVVCERLLSAPGLQVLYPTACKAPNGEFIVTGAAQPVGTASPLQATHTFVARLQANGCDTLWQRRLPHTTYNYDNSAVLADARGIWLLTPDTVINSSATPPYRGVRLWQLSAAGRVRRVVRPAAPTFAEIPQFLLPTADGGVYAQVYNRLPVVGAPQAPGILRFDSTGTLRWRRNYEYVPGYYGSSLCHTPTGNVLLTGMSGMGATYNGRVKLLEVEASRGDSLRRLLLLPGPNTSYEFLNARNEQPLETLALTGGRGYALPTVVTMTSGRITGQLTRLDASYQVLWRYQLPLPPGTNVNECYWVQQVRELADGSLLALVANRVPQRQYWLYRFNATTGAVLATYAFTTPTLPSTLTITPARLLPVISDSSLLVVASTRTSATGQGGGIYVARVRVAGLPRVVTPALPLAARPGAAGAAFALYPNPARDAVTVALPAGTPPGQLELRDALGRLVRAQAVAAGALPVRWALAGLTPGLYAVVLRGAGPPAVQHLAVE